MLKTRLEADEVAAQLERCDKENKILKDEMNKEIEAVLPPPLLSSSTQFCARQSVSHLPLIFPGVDNKDEQAFLLSTFSHLFSLMLLYLLLPPGFFRSPTSLKNTSPAWSIQVHSDPEICHVLGMPISFCMLSLFCAIQKLCLLSCSPKSLVRLELAWLSRSK